MRTLVTKAILLLGRYAVLPVAVLAVGLFIGSLAAFDDHPGMAVLALPVVLPIPHAKDRNAVDGGAAAGLWAMWTELDDATPRSRRTLQIDPHLNASIGERRRYFALAHRHLTMTVGLPLLLLRDERAVRTVVAHEVAHARLQHTTGGTNLHEFMVAAANLFDHLDAERTITGRIAHALLSSLLAWVSAEFHAIRYRNELEADRQAGERTGAHEMARSLVLLHNAAAGTKALIFDPLDKELLGAIRAPLQRLVDQLDAIRTYRAGDETEPPHEPDEPEDYHPPLRERLANLGFATVPDVELPRASAVESLVSAARLQQLLTEFNTDWRRKADALVGLH